MDVYFSFADKGEYKYIYKYIYIVYEEIQTVKFSCNIEKNKCDTIYIL